ncbi:MAG: helix-turn-helix domain-containing protein, partial [bacterium]
INDISKDALDYLTSLSYHGNVRELENIIERGVILAQNSNILNISHLSKFDIISSPINNSDNKLSKLSKINYSADNNTMLDNNKDEINERQDISINNMLNNSINSNKNNNVINNIINGDSDYNNNAGICYNNNSELFDVLSIKEMEKKLIAAALKKTGGNKNKASELLGVTARTLRNKLKEFEIQDK